MNYTPHGPQVNLHLTLILYQTSFIASVNNRSTHRQPGRIEASILAVVVTQC